MPIANLDEDLRFEKLLGETWYCDSQKLATSHPNGAEKRSEIYVRE